MTTVYPVWASKPFTVEIGWWLLDRDPSVTQKALRRIVSGLGLPVRVVSVWSDNTCPAGELAVVRPASFPVARSVLDGRKAVWVSVDPPSVVPSWLKVIDCRLSDGLRLRGYAERALGFRLDARPPGSLTDGIRKAELCSIRDGRTARFLDPDEAGLAGAVLHRDRAGVLLASGGMTTDEWAVQLRLLIRVLFDTELVLRNCVRGVGTGAMVRSGLIDNRAARKVNETVKLWDLEAVDRVRKLLVRVDRMVVEGVSPGLAGTLLARGL